MNSPSPKLLVVAGQISDESHEHWQRDQASDHVIAIPLVDGLPNHALTLLRGDIFIIDGVNGVRLQDELSVGKDGRQQSSTYEVWQPFLWITIVSPSTGKCGY